ncbi:MAG: diguanylate cyclase [Oscillospiraceae bacterium]|nr:diguanylate cyclase [Oscillospiraceae bacterium]
MAKKKKKQGTAVNRILVIQLLVMLLLLLAVSFFVASKTRESALAHMSAINDERAILINNFVDSAERTLVTYSHAKQVQDLLNNPDNDVYAATAQKYTEEYSLDVPYLEGIYISDWSTKVLAHTNHLARGMVTRTDPDALAELHDGMTKAGRGVFNTGIIESPASKNQIISMYKAIYDENHHALGLVGLGILTQSLDRDLGRVVVAGLENSTYAIVDAYSDTYAVHSNGYEIGRKPEIPQILELTEQARNYLATYDGDPLSTGRFEYKNENGKTVICNWYYLEQHNWFLLLEDEKSEVFRLSNSMLAFMLVFGVLLFVLWFIFRLINKRQEATSRKLSSQIVKTEKTKESLTTAMFKDILTDASNRVSFSMDASKFAAKPNECFYFILFNVAAFSQINIAYGNDAGDQVLLTTVEALRKVFQDGTVYRTGSDEFIVVMPSEKSQEGYKNVINAVNTAHAILLTPIETPAGNITAEYKIAVAKKTSGIDTSVISILKDMTNHSGETVFEQVQFIDLDQR